MLGILSLALAAIVWLEYLARIPRERVPRRPALHMSGQVGAIGLGFAALAGNQGRVAAAFGLGLAAFFFWVLTQSRMPEGTVLMSVGSPGIPFVATRPNGTTFSSTELAGQRVLIKFFRGHW